MWSDRIKATVEREFRERRSGDSGAWSVERETARTNTESERWDNRESWCTDATERVDVPTTRRVRTCLSLSRKVINHPSLHEPTLSASFLHTNLHYSGAENPGRKPERRRHHVFSDEFAICGSHHQALLDMREDQERRFCALVQNQQEDRELFRSWMDREVRAGGNPPAPALSTHMPLQKMGPQDWPGGVSRPLREDRGGMWVAPGELASAPHSAAVRGGAVGGAAAASSEPPGLWRPEASHPPAGRPEPRTTSPALQIARAGGKRPALHDGSPAPGRVPQMAVGRGRRRRPDHRPCSAGTIHCSVTQKDRTVGPVPPPDVAGPGHPTRGGPDGDVPRGWRNPAFRLSLSLSLLFVFFFSPFFSP